ncbi:MAG: CoA-binding protein [Chloroflexota bacterium]
MPDMPIGPRFQVDQGDRDRIRAILDLHEGRHPVPILDDVGITTVLRAARRIAVIGASEDPRRPSNDVFRYLRDRGFECVPINPNVREVLGQRAFASLAEAVAATGPIDIVDVFRRSELCVPHAKEAVAAGARCLWLQLGVVNWDAAEIAVKGGLSVVMDRCTAIEVKRLAPDPPDMSR